MQIQTIGKFFVATSNDSAELVRLRAACVKSTRKVAIDEAVSVYSLSSFQAVAELIGRQREEATASALKALGTLPKIQALNGSFFLGDEEGGVYAGVQWHTEKPLFALSLGENAAFVASAIGGMKVNPFAFTSDIDDALHTFLKSERVKRGDKVKERYSKRVAFDGFFASQQWDKRKKRLARVIGQAERIDAKKEAERERAIIKAQTLRLLECSLRATNEKIKRAAYGVSNSHIECYYESEARKLQSVPLTSFQPIEGRQKRVKFLESGLNDSKRVSIAERVERAKKELELIELNEAVKAASNSAFYASKTRKFGLSKRGYFVSPVEARRTVSNTKWYDGKTYSDSDELEESRLIGSKVENAAFEETKGQIEGLEGIYHLENDFWHSFALDALSGINEAVNGQTALMSFRVDTPKDYSIPKVSKAQRQAQWERVLEREGEARLACKRQDALVFFSTETGIKSAPKVASKALQPFNAGLQLTEREGQKAAILETARLYMETERKARKVVSRLFREVNPFLSFMALDREAQLAELETLREEIANRDNDLMSFGYLKRGDYSKGFNASERKNFIAVTGDEEFSVSLYESDGKEEFEFLAGLECSFKSAKARHDFLKSLFDALESLVSRVIARNSKEVEKAKEEKEKGRLVANVRACQVRKHNELTDEQKEAKKALESAARKARRHKKALEDAQKADAEKRRLDAEKEAEKNVEIREAQEADALALSKA